MDGIPESKLSLAQVDVKPCLKVRVNCGEISWEVIKRAQPIADGNSPVCRLCLKEATAVVYALNKKGCLNKRNEFISSCRHIKKSLLKFNKF